MQLCKKPPLMAAVVLTLTATFRLDATAQRPPNGLRETLAGIPVPLDALEDRIDWYMGLSIAIEGLVDDVFGPRLFRVADRTADGEMLVGVLAPAVAPVRTGDLVRITGRVQPLAHDEFERSWNWLALDPEAAFDMALHPVLVATRVTATGGSDVELVRTKDADSPADAVRAAPAGSPISELTTLARADRGLVGRAVALDDVTAAAVASIGGFFLRGPDRHVLVVTAEGSEIPSRGERLSVRGVVMEMPDTLEARLAPPGPMNDSVYIYANGLGW